MTFLGFELAWWWVTLVAIVYVMMFRISFNSTGFGLIKLAGCLAAVVGLLVLPFSCAPEILASPGEHVMAIGALCGLVAVTLPCLVLVFVLRRQPNSAEPDKPPTFKFTYRGWRKLS